jgi:hypothetical protein
MHDNTLPKRPRGRPRNVDRDSLMVRRSICLTPKQWIEFDARGGAARLREMLDKPRRNPAG